MLRRTTLLITALGLAAAIPAGAAHAAEDPCDTMARSTYGTETNLVYVELRTGTSALADEVWVYRESNGVPGLQRGGASSVTGYPDQCNDSHPKGPDTLIV